MTDEEANDGLVVNENQLRNALEAAVDLLNSDYIKRAFACASLHGFTGSDEELAMVKSTWDKINAATDDVLLRQNGD